MPGLSVTARQAERLWGLPGRSPYPKDGINDHLIAGVQAPARVVHVR